jgi:PAS domain S-box-containing protein
MASEPAGSDDDLQRRLAESLFRESHVSIWACDADYRIVLWNNGAAETYGRTADSVIGKRYDELFIDEAERQQSLEDCRAIIENGTRYENFLATDHDARGNERQMLTNCYRITDPLTGQHYQAEIGVEIADLPMAQSNLRTLRELGLKQMFEREQTLKIRKTHIESAISIIREEVRARSKARIEDADRAMQNISPRLGSRSVARYQTRKQAIELEEKAVLADLADLEGRLAACTGVDETVALEGELGSRDDWARRIDEADSAGA